MHVWQLQEAKAKLTELVNNCKTDPQIISRRGISEVVVISIDKYNELLQSKESIVSFFKNSPLNGVDLELARDKSQMREIEL